MKRTVAATAVLLAASACGADETATPAVETVTVTQTAEPTAPPSEPPAPVGYLDAQELLDDAATAGLDMCKRPEERIILSDAISQLSCALYTDRYVTGRLYLSDADRDADVDLFRESAGYDLQDGRDPSSVLLGGGQDGSAYWLLGARTELLQPVAATLEGELIDMRETANVIAPEPEPKPKPKPKPKPQGPPATFGGDGTYLVGEDVAAGLYRSGGPSPDDGRYCVVYTSTEPSDLNSYLRGSTIQGPVAIQVNDGEWVTAQFCQPFKRS